MTNLNFYPEKPKKAYCATEIKGLLWINQQPFWTYQCLCCKVYQFELGKVNFEWGGIYD
jgi:hypothetical protein